MCLGRHTSLQRHGDCHQHDLLVMVTGIATRHEGPFGSATALPATIHATLLGQIVAWSMRRASWYGASSGKSAAAGYMRREILEICL